MNKKEVIGLYICSKIALHTAKPYIAELKHRNISICYILNDYIYNDVALLKSENDKILDISYFNNYNKLALYLHRVLILLFTPINFSTLYGKWVEQRLCKRNCVFRKLIFILINSFPKFKRKLLIIELLL